jgi:hypothetical protein
MTARRQDSPYTNLCKFEFADGRLCSMPGLPSLNGYCKSHVPLKRHNAPAEEDLTYELSQFFSSEDGHLDVHGALQIVFKKLAGNHISNRRAAAFGYLGSLIILSDPARISDEEHRQETHDLWNYTSSALRAAYGRQMKRQQQTPPPSEPAKPSPVASSPTNHNPRPSP